MEPTEYELVEMAIVRMEASSSLKQTFFYYVPLWMITIICSSILYVAYYARDIMELRSVSANLTAWSSFAMLIIEIVFIAYRHPIQFEWAKSLIEVALRLNLFHLIIMASFVSYVKTSGDFTTYFTWSYILTIPILILSLIPILTRMYGYS